MSFKIFGQVVLISKFEVKCFVYKECFVTHLKEKKYPLFPENGFFYWVPPTLDV